MTGRKDKPWRSKTPVIVSNSDVVDKVSDDSISDVDQLSKNNSENCSEFSTLVPENVSKSVVVDEVKYDLDKWKTGEKILCFHGPLIYEAKIQNVSS